MREIDRGDHREHPENGCKAKGPSTPVGPTHEGLTFWPSETLGNIGILVGAVGIEIGSLTSKSGWRKALPTAPQINR